MNKFISRSTVKDVYFYVIELTVEALKKYLEKSEKITNKYNIPIELKTRWQARLNCLFHSLESSWLNFHESGGKCNEAIKKKEEYNYSSPTTFFPLICTLSWDILKISSNPNDKISGFKSWVWNCLIGYIISEGVHPQQAYIVRSKNSIYYEKIKKQINIKCKNKYKKDLYNRYELISNKRLNFTTNSKNILTDRHKKRIQHFQKNITSNDSDRIGSELDQDIESQIIEETEKNSPNNFILSIADKIYRRNTKWRVFLRDGIIHINTKDLLFNLCKCEFFW